MDVATSEIGTIGSRITKSAIVYLPAQASYEITLVDIKREFVDQASLN
jgi:hypothetical protein